MVGDPGQADLLYGTAVRQGVDGTLGTLRSTAFWPFFSLLFYKDYETCETATVYTEIREEWSKSGLYEKKGSWAPSREQQRFLVKDLARVCLVSPLRPAARPKSCFFLGFLAPLVPFMPALAFPRDRQCANKRLHHHAAPARRAVPRTISGKREGSLHLIRGPVRWLAICLAQDCITPHKSGWHPDLCVIHLLNGERKTYDKKQE